MTTFAVSGSATKTSPAELATLRVTVAFTSSDRSAVRSDSIAAHATVTDEAAAHHDSGAATAWTADGVTTDSYREFVPGDTESIVRYRAQSSIAVTFTDFDVLADWVGDLAERPGVNIDGISWSLTESVRAGLLREVRIEAVHDAIAKANDYAAALDVVSPTLDAVFEEGLRPNVGGSGSGFARDSVMLKTASFDGGSYALRPADIEVTSSISADFTM